MMFIDTNYFLRYLLNDTPDQNREVTQLFEDASEGKVILLTSPLVIFETAWVLRSSYELNKDELYTAMGKVLKLSFIQLNERDILAQALTMFEKTNLSLEDCYNFYYAKSRGVKSGNFKTFDRRLRKEFNK